MIAYHNGRFLPKDEIFLSPDDRGFLFADGVYEVIRAYRGTPFLIEDHLRRLARSLQEVRITAPDPGEIRGAIARLIDDNRLKSGDALVYVQITRGVAPRKHAFPNPPVPPTVYVTASPFEPDVKALKEGVGILLAPDIRWLRCDIKAVSLLPNVLACQQAKEKGVYESVFVRDGMVTEGTHTNVCAVFNGWLVTHPESHRILSGVTRKRVLELCLELGIPFEEAPIPSHQLSAASEIMLLGTMTEIMPVVKVDDWTVGNGRPGPVCAGLQDAFMKLTSA